ncbi:MAG: ECF transporter S component, partial [Eubacterium sp.]
MKNQKTSDLVKVSLFVAIIVLMAVTPFLGYIPLGFTRATIIHVPVIIGSIILGPIYGGFLGFVFGLTSLINNTFNPTVTSFVFTPFYSLGDYSGNFLSLVICFVPRILVGIVPYYVYKGMRKIKKNDALALGTAGVCGSLVNTLLVMNMI